MKLLIALFTLASFSSFAAELKVMDIPTKKLQYAQLVSTRFEVDSISGNHGVSVRADTVVGYGDAMTTETEYFEAEVAALTLNGDLLTVTIDGTETVCGKMGVTRIFKRSVLRTNTNCAITTKRNGKNTEVYIVTK